MKRILRITFSSISILTLVYFAIPKITAQPTSVKGFTQFEEVLPIDGTYFMYLTGYIELLIALIILGSLLISKYRIVLTVLGFGMLFLTMLGGLLTEFFVRPEPKMLLVVIAILLIAISSYQLKSALGKM